MAEYIEREELLAKLKERDLCLCVSEFDIKEAPAADVAPVVHGRWEFVNDYQSQCTNCKEMSWVDHDNEPRYCPDCGARMDLVGCNEQTEI